MHQSLADIISKEQADRKAAQDSVAKRSLQEIQEEQAFQVSPHPSVCRTQMLTAKRNGGTKRAAPFKRRNKLRVQDQVLVAVVEDASAVVAVVEEASNVLLHKVALMILSDFGRGIDGVAFWQRGCVGNT